MTENDCGCSDGKTTQERRRNWFAEPQSWGSPVNEGKQKAGNQRRNRTHTEGTDHIKTTTLSSKRCAEVHRSEYLPLGARSSRRRRRRTETRRIFGFGKTGVFCLLIFLIGEWWGGGR